MTNIKDNEIPELKIGDVFYECEMGFNIEARVTSVPTETKGYEDRRQWEWEAENTQNGSKISYFATEGMTHYGPRLYREPQYVKIVNGEPTIPLAGTGEDHA